MKLFLKKKNKDIVGYFLIIVHIVGAIGISIESSRNIFLFLVPYNLILTFILSFFYVSIVKYFRPIFLIFLLGFFFELIGVKTGILFGEYSYGDTLGFKVLNIPLVIGLNWAVLSLATYSLFSHFLNNKYMLIIFSSLSMVLLDLIIEPVAIKFSFWSWAASSVPIQNYIMWFFISIIMHIILLLYKANVHYKFGLYIILSQAVFFIYLNLI